MSVCERLPAPARRSAPPLEAPRPRRVQPRPPRRKQTAKPSPQRASPAEMETNTEFHSSATASSPASLLTPFSLIFLNFLPSFPLPSLPRVGSRLSSHLLYCAMYLLYRLFCLFLCSRFSFLPSWLFFHSLCFPESRLPAVAVGRLGLCSGREEDEWPVWPPHTAGNYNHY